MHINKTSGKSINFWLKQNGVRIPPHNHNIIQYFDNTFFYFTVVRNPYDRVVRNPYDRVASQFLHWKNNLKRIKSDIAFDFYINNLDQPDLWLETGKEFYLKRFNEPCSNWIKSDKINVFKFENLENLENYFKTNHGFEGKLPHLNKSNEKKSYLEMYSEKTKEIVFTRMKVDFERFYD